MTIFNFNGIPVCVVFVRKRHKLFHCTSAARHRRECAHQMCMASGTQMQMDTNSECLLAMRARQSTYMTPPPPLLLLRLGLPQFYSIYYYYNHNIAAQRLG